MDLGQAVDPEKKPWEQTVSNIIALPSADAASPQANDAWDALVSGRADALRVHAGTDDTPKAVFPGAFNPLHAGHVQMAEHAERKLGCPVEFELSVANVDKATIDRSTAFARAEQFAMTQRVLLSRSPTFVEKAAIFPGAVFVVGVDTIARVGEIRYYGDAAARDAAITQIASLGCRYLVFGRNDDATDEFLTLSTLDLPPALAALCDGVTETEFRLDISSTALREAAQKKIE